MKRDFEREMTKTEQITQALESFHKLLPNVSVKNASEALDACWYDGITLEQLTKASYQYLYPPREPSLW